MSSVDGPHTLLGCDKNAFPCSIEFASGVVIKGSVACNDSAADKQFVVSGTHECSTICILQAREI